MVVCHCCKVNDRKILKLVNNGAKSVKDIIKGCGAGSKCAGCVGTIKEIICRQSSSGELASNDE